MDRKLHWLVLKLGVGCLPTGCLFLIRRAGLSTNALLQIPKHLKESFLCCYLPEHAVCVCITLSFRLHITNDQVDRIHVLVESFLPYKKRQFQV